jgi:hypothetical protein
MQNTQPNTKTIQSSCIATQLDRTFGDSKNLLLIIYESKTKTHNRIHTTICANKITSKCKKPTTTNLYVLNFQITKNDLRTHNLKLYLKHELT